MEKAAYYEIATYLKQADRAVSPHELSVILGKSRVTVQTSLKRLLKNGWVVKEGSSPHTLYRGIEIELMPKTVQKGKVTIEELRDICKIGLIEDFVLKSHKIRQKPVVADRPSEVYSKSMKPLICFDLDGTLTTKSSWEGLNLLLGISPEEDYRMFKEYLNGTLEYKTWVRNLVESYKANNAPVTQSQISTLADSIELAPGALEAVHAAQEKGYNTILMSGSIDTIVETMAKRLGFSEWYACSKALYNENEELVDIESMGDERDAKLTLLKKYAEEKGYDLSEIITIGDGGNELELFKVTKGILVGNNKDLTSVSWKQVATLPEVIELI